MALEQHIKNGFASPLRGGGPNRLVQQYYNSASKAQEDRPGPFVDGEEQSRHKNKVNQLLKKNE